MPIVHFFPTWPHKVNWLKGCEPFKHEVISVKPDDLIEVARASSERSLKCTENVLRCCGLITPVNYNRLIKVCRVLDAKLEVIPEAFSVVAIEVEAQAS